MVEAVCRSQLAGDPRWQEVLIAGKPAPTGRAMPAAWRFCFGANEPQDGAKSMLLDALWFAQATEIIGFFSLFQMVKDGTAVALQLATELLENTP